MLASGKVGREAEDAFIAAYTGNEDADQDDAVVDLAPATDQALAEVVRAEVQALDLPEHEESTEFVARYEKAAAVVAEAVA